MYEEIKRLLAEINPYVEFKEGMKLLDEGILDSMEIIALVMLLEDTFDIEIPDEAITKEYFGTIESIAAFVQELIEEKGASCL